MSESKVLQLQVARSIDEHLIGDVAEDVRQFLRSTWLGDESVPLDPQYLHGGRELIEDFAIRATALADDRIAALRGQNVGLREVAQVLHYLSQLEVRHDAKCYGCGRDAATCGHMNVLSWLSDQVARHAPSN